MKRWRKRKGGSVLAAMLAAVGLLAVPPAMRSQQDSAAAVSGPDGSSASVEGSAGNAGQQAAVEELPGPPFEAPSPATPDGQNARLAVNPVTGLTISPASHFVPLTGEERWKLYWKQSFLSVGAYFKPVTFALVLDQASDSPSQWGGGFSGFGLRVASRIGSNTVQGAIRAPLAAVLHEDVRYISDQRGGKRRVWHAIEYSFLTYNNEGQPTLNVAKLVGYYGSTAISTTWRPGHHALLDYTLVNGSEQIGLSVPINILQEFWPDIGRKMGRLWH